MGALQPMHLIIVLVIILLVFGPGKLPELGRAVGDGMRELKRATSSDANTTATSSTATSTAPHLEPRATSAAVCLSCQAPLPINSRFCGGCGSQVETAPRVAALV